MNPAIKAARQIVENLRSSDYATMVGERAVIHLKLYEKDMAVDILECFGFTKADAVKIIVGEIK